MTVLPGDRDIPVIANVNFGHAGPNLPLPLGIRAAIDADARTVDLLEGSGVLLRWLLEHDLVDELKLVIFPVVLGAGFRLFPEQGQTHRLELLTSETSPNGVMLQTYRPAGRATFADIEE